MPAFARRERGGYDLGTWRSVSPPAVRGTDFLPAVRRRLISQLIGGGRCRMTTPTAVIAGSDSVQ